MTGRFGFAARGPGGAAGAASSRRRRLAALVVAAAAVALPLRAEAQTTLVSNVNKQSRSESASIQSQPFTAGGSGLGFTLTSVEVGLGTGTFSDATVRIVPNSASGEPDLSDPTRFIQLTAPTSVVNGSLNTFTAPAGTTLAAETTYHVYVTDSADQRAGGNIDMVAPGQDAGGAAGWSIGDTRYWRSDKTDSWSTSTDRMVRMRVSGYANALEVGHDWTFTPEAVGAGGAFRLLFVSSTKLNATSTDIEVYNAFVQAAARAGHADIRAYADDFAVLGSTADVNARANTRTRAVDSDAPIYWVHASSTRLAVADGHADFYDGSWGGGGPRSETGAAVVVTADDPVATGTSFAGLTEQPLGPDGVWVWDNLTGTLTPNSLFPNDSYRFLGLSPVFRVAEASSAALGHLSVADGDGVVAALDPPFRPEETSYTATVTTARATILGRAAAEGGTVEYLSAFGNPLLDQDPVADGIQLDLPERGVHEYQVRVTSPDGNAMRTYSVTVVYEGKVLVTNLGTTGTSYVGFAAQRFRTGTAHPLGYRLTSVTVPTTAPLRSREVTLLTVWTGDAEPARRIASLVTPPSGPAQGNLVFEAPHERVFLDPDTSYFVVVNHGLTNTNLRLRSGITMDPAETSDYGWVIADEFLDTADSDPDTWVTLENTSLRMQVNGELLEPACEAPVGDDRTEIWSSTLTVGVIRFFGVVSAYGFRRTGSVGSLSDEDFALGTTALVDQLSVGTGGELVFEESPALADRDWRALRLHVCGDAFDFADAEFRSAGRTTWIADSDRVDLDWSAERTLTVALSASPDATLRALRVDGEPVPDFDPETLEYTVSVEKLRVTVGPVVNRTGAFVDYLDADDAPLDDADVAGGFQVDLTAGEDTTVKLRVTSGDRGTTRTYEATLRHVLAEPEAPRAAPTAGSTTSLDVSWAAHAETEVDGYDLRYRVRDSSASFADGPQGVAGTSAVVSGLAESTDYEVQVRARIGSVESDWSPGGFGLTHAPEAKVRATWSLTPAGLAVGAKFRLLFVSHNTRWNRNQIHRYNDWMREYAAGENSGRGHADIRAFAGGFRAVACDASINARVNTGTQWDTTERGVPIYWLDGLIAADDYGDFYDGSWQNEDAPRTEAGDLKPSSFDGEVTTGCTANGTSRVGSALGSDQGVGFGRLNGDGGPLFVENLAFSAGSTAPIYALSQVFVVADAPAEDVQVDIASNHEVVGAGVDDLVFTLTRAGDTAAALDATVDIVQDESWLDAAELRHTVSFGIGDSEKDLTLGRAAFSFAPASSGNLKATVSGFAVAGGEKTVQVVSRGVGPVTVGLDQPMYTFAENATSTPIHYVAKLHPDYPRPPTATATVFDVGTTSGTALEFRDYDAEFGVKSVSGGFTHDGTAYVARGDIGFDVLDDPFYEGAEHLTVDIGIAPDMGEFLWFVRPDGTTCDPGLCGAGKVQYPVTITDDEFDEAPDLGEAFLSGLAVNDGTADLALAPAFAGNRFAYAARTNATTTQVTVTATPADGNAAVAFVDADGAEVADAGMAAGHQVDLAEGANVIRARVTAAGGDPVLVYRVTVTRGGDSDDVPVAIAADRDRIVAGERGVLFGLSLAEALPDDLVATVEIVQDEDWLAAGDLVHIVTIEEDFPSATLALPASAFSTDPDADGTLTATVSGAGIAGSSATVQVLRRAPEVVALVSNLEQTRVAGTSTGNELVQAQRFTTGDAGGYTLSSVQMEVSSFGTGDSAAVSIYDKNASDDPGTSLHALTNTSVADGLNTFTAPADATLDPETDYFVVMEAPAGSWSMGITTSDAEDAGAASGWSIADVGHFKGTGGWNSEPRARMIAVFGTEADLPPRVESITRFDPTTSPTNADSLTWLVVFSEDVANVDPADFAVASTTANLSTLVATDSAARYRVTASGGDLPDLTDTVTLSFADDQDIEDLADNPLADTDPTGDGDDFYDVDNTAPTVEITVPATSTGTFEAAFEFSEPVTGFAQTDIDVGNGTAVTFAGTGRSYTADITPQANGEVTVDVAEDVAEDAAGNGNSAAVRATSTYMAPGPVTNNAPAFDEGASATRSVAEDAAPGTAIGAPVSATDADGDPLAYSLSGTDVDAFGIDRGTGQLTTSAALDHETKPTHSVTVEVSDGRGGTDEIAVTVNVTDEDEPPSRPGAPRVTATANTSDSLDVDWDAPVDTDRPAVSGYRLQYRSGGGWTEVPQTVTDTTHTIPGLMADTAYEVQVRALNAEGESPWSASGSGSTGSATNTAPAFDEGASASRSVAEDAPPGTAIGDPVAATDADGDPLAYSLPGTDAGAFGIDRGTGQLRTSAALDYETKPTHSVTVEVSDGRGGTDEIAVTVSVTDEDEPPSRPGAPRVTATANTSDSLDVDWDAPVDTDRPAVSGYRLQYRSGGGWTEVPQTVTDTTHTIPGLMADTAYEVQVRALNAEGESPWSASGSGSTGSAMNTAPAFDEGAGASRSVAEDAPPGTAIGAPVAATDDDGDTLTYSLSGTDAGSFAIDAATGQLRTSAALDHETKPSHSLTVEVSDGRGGADAIAVTVNVTDGDEPPPAPDAPTVTTTADRGCSLDVSWTAPGGSEILGYRLSHGEHDGRAGYWSAPKEYPATARSARIERLAQDTEYRAKVQAVNAEGRSDWSPAGTGRTGFDRSPVFRDGARTTRVVAENTARQGPVGAPVVADDPEGVPRYTLEGPDADSFRIEARTGQLRTGALLDLDHESRSSYLVTVKAAASSPCPRPPDIDAGEPVTIEVAVEVGDVEEPPGTPRLNVSAVEGDGTRLRAGWSAAENTGPPAVYDLRHREAGGVGWTDGPGGVAGRSATIAGLARDTEYEVQVRARNDEGESAWSASARGTTDSERSVRMDMVAVYEGETAAFTIEVTRAAEAGEDLRLSWRTREIDARAGDDFRPDSASHQLAVGQTEVTGEVETFEDNDDNEGVEAFQIVVTLDSAGETISLARRILIQDGPRPASATPMARVVGDLLTLYYADPLDAGSTPGPKDWVVRAATADGARTLAVTGVSVSGAEVALSLSAPAAAGESVSVSYLPWAMHPLLGLDGVEATPLTELKVRNETPAIAPEAAPDPAPVAGGRAAEEHAGPAPLGPWLAALLAERPAASVVRLDLPERGLTDVSPLAAFTGLEVLDLHGNAVVDVWPLGALAKLRRLDLSHNRVEDVSALAGLQGLEVLLLDGNRVTDVLPLALLPRLARLDLSGNRVADALLLAELRSLSRLDLSGNRVGDASPLGDLSRLVWLDLSGNPVSDVAPLGRLTRLRWLWLDAQTPGLGTLAPLAEGPAPARIERRAQSGQPVE